MRIQNTYLTNEEFFTIRFQKTPGEIGVDLFQEFGEQEVYLMTLDNESLVEILYQLENMLNDD